MKDVISKTAEILIMIECLVLFYFIILMLCGVCGDIFLSKWSWPVDGSFIWKKVGV